MEGSRGTKERTANSSPSTRWIWSKRFSPAECGHCQKPLTAGGNPEEGKYFRYQVPYIPEAKRHVNEYRLRCIRCECGAETWAALPRIARSGFGTRLTAFAAYLTGVYRVTRRDLIDIFKTIFGIDVSLGSVCKLHEDVSRALEPSYEEIKKALPQQRVLNLNETGWREHGTSPLAVDLRGSFPNVLYINAFSGSESSHRHLG